eukprot:7382716-Prymnesium_polylepis.1
MGYSYNSQYGYSCVSESEGDEDQYEHCGILSTSPSCARGVETADLAAPTSATPPSARTRLYETIAGEALYPVSYMLYVSDVKLAVKSDRLGTTSCWPSLTCVTASCAAHVTCFHVCPGNGFPRLVFGNSSPT